ncbi:MAG: DUF4129 domain-containing protein [Candidatus Rokuibacteriota bacterium]
MASGWVPLAAVSFVVGLTALVRMASPASEVPDVATRVIRLPEPLTIAIVSLFGLTALVLFAHAIRRARRRPKEEDELFQRLAAGPPLPPWVRAIMRILPLLYLVAVVYLLWHGYIPIESILTLGHGTGDAIGSALARPAPLSAPAFLTWTFGLVLLGTALGALVLALLVAFADRLTWWRDDQPPDDELAAPLAEAVEESVDDLRADSNARRAIIGCYRKFERVAAGSRVARKPWWTPTEFMREALRSLPVPPPALRALTGLFELARFSHHALGPKERDLALEALLEIKTALEAQSSDVVAG